MWTTVGFVDFQMDFQRIDRAPQKRDDCFCFLSLLLVAESANALSGTVHSKNRLSRLPVSAVFSLLSSVFCLQSSVFSLAVRSCGVAVCGPWRVPGRRIHRIHPHAQRPIGRDGPTIFKSQSDCLKRGHLRCCTSYSVACEYQLSACIL